MKMIKLAALVILSLIFNFCGNDKQPEAKNKIASEEQNNEEKIQNLELNKIDDDYKTYEWDLKFPYTRQSIYLPPFFNDKEPKTDLYPVQTVYDDTPICNTDETACRAKCTKECLDQIKGLNYNLAKISDSELINKLVIKSKREGGCEKIKINYEKPFNLNNPLQRGRLFVSSTDPKKAFVTEKEIDFNDRVIINNKKFCISQTTFKENKDKDINWNIKPTVNINGTIKDAVGWSNAPIPITINKKIDLTEDLLEFTLPNDEMKFKVYFENAKMIIEYDVDKNIGNYTKPTNDKDSCYLYGYFDGLKKSVNKDGTFYTGNSYAPKLARKNKIKLNNIYKSLGVSKSYEFILQCTNTKENNPPFLERSLNFSNFKDSITFQ